MLARCWFFSSLSKLPSSASEASLLGGASMDACKRDAQPSTQLLQLSR